MQNGPLTRYAKSRVVHAPGMPEHFPHHRLQRKPIVSDPGMHHGTCVTHVPWCVSGSLNRCGGENVPGILGACPTRNFTYLVRGPIGCAWCPHGIIGQFPTSQMTSKMAEENVEISQFVSFVEIVFSYFFLYILRANGYIFINKTIQCGPFGKVSEYNHHENSSMLPYFGKFLIVIVFSSIMEINELCVSQLTFQKGLLSSSNLKTVGLTQIQLTWYILSVIDTVASTWIDKENRLYEFWTHRPMIWTHWLPGKSYVNSNLY